MALAAASLLLVSACSQEQSQKAGTNAAALPKPEVGVVTLQPQSVSINAEMPGRTTASLVAEVRPQVGGIIEQRLFTEGSEVKEGDALYQIEPASYKAAYESAAADLQRAEATVPSAQSMVTRYQGLIKQNAVSKQDLDNAVASLAQAKADVAAAKAALETARINLDYTSIKAPISGRIDRSTLTPGALVTASQDTALTTIRTLDPINVDVTQSSTNLLNLRQAIQDGRIKISGENVSVRLKLENGAIYPLPGKLEFAESAVSETTGTFTLRATFPNPDRLLLPGMYVRALVEEGVAPNSFLLPQRGVSRNAKGEPTGLFVNAENKVEERVLEVRQSVGNNWLVNGGVAAGDRVIVEGSQLVRAGQEVQAVDVIVDDTTGEVRERKQAQTTDGAGSQLTQNQTGNAAVKE
ncbi:MULTISPECIES: efflux RND transporter periplasmic adaptor subunit [Brucella/Ochrobactrum group]|nr:MULTISPECIES: efflux RND transporter periplasmic adaptor subunit [Brucella]MDX4075936.1 efflux RND transporter periplasmic adaptor subunit [Brucella sp. NBRC 113783]SPL63180.1 RND efflux system, membrane fusion protein CmeA [[Ochrobactrum] soli]